MHFYKYKRPAKFTGLIITIIMLSGCYSFSEHTFCPFGMEFGKDTDFSALVIVDGNNNQISRNKQKTILKESRLYSSKVINDTYDLAEYLCVNKELPEEKYQRLEDIAKIYLHSYVVPLWTWSENGKMQPAPLLQALENNDQGHVITGTLCVTGLCTHTEHETFCKKRGRTELENTKLKKLLSDYYLVQKKYKLTYPKEKVMSYCKGPKW
ncbi:hypothetical protein [Serratia sp. 2723]|uniref:hypothetical protein n=1 Tax=unclassified Serratia (in: enterobacteria) TaxID=2647522 RepID=UPI003D227EB2